MTPAQEAAAEAIALADAGANKKWKELVYQLLLETAREARYFTADHVFAKLDAIPDAPVTRDNRAFGAVILRAARAGICRKTDKPYVPSTRRNCHAKPLPIWESLIRV